MNASPEASLWRDGRVRSAEASWVPTIFLQSRESLAECFHRAGLENQFLHPGTFGLRA